MDFFPIGWDSKVYLLLAGIASILVDNGKGLFLWGDEFNLFCRFSVRKKYNLLNFNPLIHGRGADLPPIALQAKYLKIYKVSKNWKNEVSLFLDLSFLSL